MLCRLETSIAARLAAYHTAGSVEYVANRVEQQDVVRN
jgi:hypothetical protein